MGFLRELTQVLLYLLTSEEDFHCSTLLCLVRELCVNSVLVPLLDLASDPDYINQIIIWLCKDIPVTSEVFLTTLRCKDIPVTSEVFLTTLRCKDIPVTSEVFLTTLRCKDIPVTSEVFLTTLKPRLHEASRRAGKLPVNLPGRSTCTRSRQPALPPLENSTCHTACLALTPCGQLIDEQGQRQVPSTVTCVRLPAPSNLPAYWPRVNAALGEVFLTTLRVTDNPVELTATKELIYKQMIVPDYSRVTDNPVELTATKELIYKQIEVFLTTLRVTDNPVELTATKELIYKQMIEVFLTTLRVTDNPVELTATKELIYKQMMLEEGADTDSVDLPTTDYSRLLSAGHKLFMLPLDVILKNNEGADTDSVDLPTTDYSRLLSAGHKLFMLPLDVILKNNEGADTDSVDLPTTDYSRLLSAGHKLFMLPLDVILKNNVALSYFIDYMTTISSQAYLFFYLNVEGWRVSTEQQMSDLALQRLQVPVERAVDVAATLDHPHSSPDQIMDRMREAAYSIFEQYLSEK
ncbi:sorting nexin 13, partial [Homalodisca vitripennis]